LDLSKEFFILRVSMKAITKPISRGVIEIRVLKQTSAIYFFKVGIPDLGMTKMKCQNIGQNKANFNISCWNVQLL
jgi:hypothetical protein